METVHTFWAAQAVPCLQKNGKICSRNILIIKFRFIMPFLSYIQCSISTYLFFILNCDLMFQLSS